MSRSGDPLPWFNTLAWTTQARDTDSLNDQASGMLTKFNLPGKGPGSFYFYWSTTGVTENRSRTKKAIRGCLDLKNQGQNLFSIPEINHLKKKKKPHNEQNQNPNFPPSFQDKKIINFGNLGWNPDSSPIGICTMLRKLLFSFYLFF